MIMILSPRHATPKTTPGRGGACKSGRMDETKASTGFISLALQQYT
jgi:hypothetical protein